MGRDERYFRSLNEQIVRDVTGLGFAGLLPLVCECGDAHCFRLIRASGAEFEALCAAPGRYAIFVGHENVERERLLAANDRFVLVEKLDAA
jgi:hypothetical protein